MKYSAQKQDRRFEGLDLARFIAAVLIVLYHYTFHGPGAFDLTWISLPEIAAITKYFYMGVPLFFVISGFVIASSTTGRTISEFARARVARIYPTFLVCMTITFVVSELFGRPQIEVSVQQWFANLFIAAPLLKSPYMDSVYWSIVYEATFYGLVAGAMWLGLVERRLPEMVGSWLLISCTNEFVFGSELVRRVLITNYSAFFASGMLIYSMLNARRTTLAQPLLLWAIVLGAVQSDLNSDWLRDHGVKLSHSIVISLGLAAPLFVACFAMVRRLPISPAVLIGLGGLTYPLYLLHQTIGYIVFNHSAARDYALLLVASTAIAMIALAWLFYEVLDKPLHTQCRRALDRFSVAIPRLVGVPR